LVVSALLKGA
jgi:hypothetical protein